MNSFFTYIIFCCCCLRERSELFLFCKIYWEPFPCLFFLHLVSHQNSLGIKQASVHSSSKNGVQIQWLSIQLPIWVCILNNQQQQKHTNCTRKPKWNEPQKKQKQNTKIEERRKTEILKRPTQGRNFVLCWICPVFLGDQQKLKFWEELQQQETGKKKKKRWKNWNLEERSTRVVGREE